VTINEADDRRKHSSERYDATEHSCASHRATLVYR
jgi:hypothetical protein